MRHARALAFPFIAACALTSNERDAWPDAARGVASAELGSLCAEAWEARLEDDPIGATYLGDARHSGELADSSPAGEAKRLARVKRFFDRAQELDARAVTQQYTITRSCL
jgi:hypothetical protein